MLNIPRIEVTFDNNPWFSLKGIDLGRESRVDYWVKIGKYTLFISITDKHGKPWRKKRKESHEEPYIEGGSLDRGVPQNR